MQPIYHALVLNLHQPAGNLDELLARAPWEAHEILYALDRIPRSLWPYEDRARVHLSLSGILLEALSNSDFQRRVYGIVDLGSLIWYLQNEKIFKILGTGYYYPILPLIPEMDRIAQIERWQGISKRLFCRDRFLGFWPPEMGFSMEMIPILRRFGYRYVLVDSQNVHPVTPMRWEEIRYRPHIARYKEDEIVVVVRDRELSNAQETGMDPAWFEHEVHERTKWCDTPPLVTTCTDGDNGGWFRSSTPGDNYWSAFYTPMLDRSMESGITPTFIDDYLDRFGPFGEVTVDTAAWNTGWHDGSEFVQWTGSSTQRDGLARIARISREIQTVRDRAAAQYNSAALEQVDNAYWRLLRSETSCNFFWGEAWVERSHSDMEASLEFLRQAEALL